MKKVFLLVLISLTIISCNSTKNKFSINNKEQARLLKERALILYKAGELPGAYKEALIANKIDPKDPEIYNLLGLIELKQKNYKEALIYFKNAIKIDKNYSESLNNIGSIYLIEGKIDKAIQYFKKALNNPLYQNNYIAFTNLAYAFYLKGDHNKALDYLDKALHYNPRYYLAYFYRGLMLFNQGKWKEALLYFKRAVRFNRKDMQSRYYLAITYFRLGNENIAIKILHSITELDPDSIWALKAEQMLIFLEKDSSSKEQRKY